MRLSVRAMSFELTAVAHPTRDIARPVLILENRTAGQRALVASVPYGLQRKCNEMKIRTGRLHSVFLAGKLDWGHVAGLPGLILTVSDQGVQQLALHHSGNSVLQYMVCCWRYFIFRFGLRLEAVDSNEPVECGGATFTPVNIASTQPVSKSENTQSNLDKLKVLVSGIFPVPESSSTPTFNSARTADVTLPKSISNPEVSTNWIITPNSVRGKFLVQKAKQLGVPPPLFKTLCAYEPVTLENGETIEPQSVLEPTKHFNPILIIDVPSAEHMSNFFEKDWQAQSPNGLPYSAVYHLIDESISAPLDDPNYRAFIESFHKSTLHFISHMDYCMDTLNFKKTYRISLKWKSLLSDFFPLGKWSNEPLSIIPPYFESRGYHVLPLLAGQKLSIKPSEFCKLEPANVESLTNSVDELIQIYDEEVSPVGLTECASRDQVLQWINERNSVQILSTKVDTTKSLKDQVETLILGTGSAIPSQIRNVISSIVRVPYLNEDGSTGFRTVVLDAGEGSLGLLKRHYNEKEVNMLLDDLSLVYLSHLHADHHLGIVDFLQEWSKRQTGKKLYLVTPWQYPKFLEELSQIDHQLDMSNIVYLSCEEFNQNSVEPYELNQLPIEDIHLEELSSGELTAPRLDFVKDNNKASQMYQYLNMVDAQTCPAFHCEFAYSCAFNFRLSSTETFKVSYSGDTRPKYQFSTIGTGSDLLLHESTLEDTKLKDAYMKRHSTTAEAIQVGIIMQAKKIILTHFSQRYRTFTGAEEVYARLASPQTKSTMLEMMTKKGQQAEFDSKALPSDLTDPIELHSPIFDGDLTEEMINQAKKIEVLFAMDNMHIVYSKLGKQREVFEREGDKLEQLFSNDKEGDDEIDDEFNEGDNSKKGKKRKLAN